ncbi:MAG: uroporphyrinogen-III C-methyltransferase [Proteobacteria bacterium]|nr:uroporphyrinogen-III C-methyltransferase [Pseudomonadota bacterium]
MSSEEKDNNKPGEKKITSPKQVVVTHYGKKKKQVDVPPEIVPTEPTHIVSSPVDIGSESRLEKSIQFENATKASLPESKPFYRDTYVKTEARMQSASQIPPDDTDTDDKENKGGGGGASLFFSFLSLFAILVVGYYAYANYQQLEELQKRTNDDQTSILALTTQAHKTLEQFAALHDQNLSEQQKLESLKSHLETEQMKLSALSSNADWVVAQANYLVFMANERLKTAHDITTAVAQLIAADDQLKSLANPAFLWVREVLAKDIAKLKAFPTVNRSEIWEELGLINLQFDKLQFKNISYQQPNKESVSPDKSMNAWQKGLWYSWQELKSLIRITHVQENRIPLALSVQEKSQIIRTLQLLAEQARWALLQGENKIYQSSLQAIQSWVSTYFDSDKTMQDLLNQIQHLTQENVDISTPDISSSIQALSKAMIEISNKNSLSPQREPQ